MDPKPSKESTMGWVSTILVFIGAPIAALLVTSPMGWVIYAVSAAAGIIHHVRNRDKAMSAQFIYYLVINVIAITARLI